MVLPWPVVKLPAQRSGLAENRLVKNRHREFNGPRLHIKEEHRKELQKIIRDVYCPKLLQCYHSRLQILCKAREIGLQSLVECLEEYPDKCPFSLSLSGLVCCKCPVRVYIAKNIEK